MSDSNATPQFDAHPSAVGAAPVDTKRAGSGGRGSRFDPTWQVFFGLLTAYLGLGMVVPVMAPLIRELGLTEFQGGLIFAVNYLMWVLASPVWGGRADMWGRKPIIILGLIGFSIGHVLF
ncbi:MAG: MFS family permease, partial [Kiritimatiellia bacterium]